MTFLRLVLAIVAGLLCPASLLADATAPATPATPAPATAEAPPPFTMEKHYSADIAVSMKDGMNIQSKTFVDGDKMRSNVNMSGMDMAMIVRRDTKKMYRIMEAQKLIMVSDLDPDKLPGGMGSSYTPEGKFELIGPDTVDGVACTKYKVTPDKTKQLFFFWLDTAKKIPVEMAAVDGSFSVKWSNYVVGPQDAALFEPPAGYQTMEMPMTPPGMPGGPGGGQ
jgi:hypothetical protein